MVISGQTFSLSSGCAGEAAVLPGFLARGNAETRIDAVERGTTRINVTVVR
jgi:hypothetical protein